MLHLVQFFIPWSSGSIIIWIPTLILFLKIRYFNIYEMRITAISSLHAEIPSYILRIERWSLRNSDLKILKDDTVFYGVVFGLSNQLYWVISRAPQLVCREQGINILKYWSLSSLNSQAGRTDLVTITQCSFWSMSCCLFTWLESHKKLFPLGADVLRGWKVQRKKLLVICFTILF